MPVDEEVVDTDQATEEEELILTTNYAEDTEIANRAVNYVKKMWDQCTQDRSTLDERYINFLKIWKTEIDITYYDGFTQIFVPQLRKNIEFAVRNLRRNLFPTDDYFSVEPVDTPETEAAEKLKRFIYWQLMNKVMLKRYVTPFLRQLCMYGWSPVKVVWERQKKKVYTHEKETVPKYEMVMNNVTGLKERQYAGTDTIIKQVEREIYVADNPTFLPVDIFSFYMWPVTAWDIDKDAHCTMEELSLGKSDLKSMEREGRYANVDKATRTMPKDDRADRRVTKEKRAQDAGISTNSDSMVPVWRPVEYWGKFDLFGDGNDIDCLITVDRNSNTALEVRQNPHYDQSPAYVVAKMDELIGEFYAYGLIQPLETLQYLLNDTTKQMNDVMLFSLSPIVAYDDGGILNSNKLQIAPGNKWPIHPNDVAFLKPPDVSQSAVMTVQNTADMIDNFPGFEKIPTTGRRPATQVSAMQQDRGITILDWSENIECMVMNKFLKKCYMLNQQFLDDEVAFKVMGKDLERMSPEELIGDYHFYWMGANNTQNMIVKSQQMLNGLEIMTKIPSTMEEQGDPWYVFKEWWKKGLGLDNADRITKKIDLTEQLNPQQENYILALGKQLPVNPMDNDEEHIQWHLQAIQSPTLSEYVKSIIKFHIQLHYDKMTKNKMASQMSQMNSQGQGGNQGQGVDEQSGMSAGGNMNQGMGG